MIGIDIASLVIVSEKQLCVGNVPTKKDLPPGSSLVAEGQRPSYSIAPLLVGLCPHHHEIMQAQVASGLAIPFACGWTMRLEDDRQQSGTTHFKPHKACKVTWQLLVHMVTMASAAKTAAQLSLAVSPMSIAADSLLGLRAPANSDEQAAMERRFLEHIAAMFPADSSAESLAVAREVVANLKAIVESCPVAPQEGHDGAIKS